MLNFYFTYGTDERYPYRGGWTTVTAPDYKKAVEVFRTVHPNIRKGIINCADIYSEMEFRKVFDGDNYGAAEHEHLYYAYADSGLTPEQIGYTKDMNGAEKNDIQPEVAQLMVFINTHLTYHATKIDIAKAMKKLNGKTPLSGNPQTRINQVIAYLAENGAFHLKDGKLSVDDSRVPELQTQSRDLKTMLIRRIKNACEKG